MRFVCEKEADQFGNFQDIQVIIWGSGEDLYHFDMDPDLRIRIGGKWNQIQFWIQPKP